MEEDYNEYEQIERFWKGIKMNREKIDELIEKAKQKSKEDFLRFVTDIYGVDEGVFEHIFEVPIISRYDAAEFADTSLSTKTDDELFEIVNEEINGEKIWDDKEDIAKYINFDEIASLSKSERREWYDIIKYNAAIVYNDELITKRINRDSKKIPETELYEIYEKILKETLTHERVHINNAYYDINLKKMTGEEVEAEKAFSYDEDKGEYEYEDILEYHGDGHYQGMMEHEDELNGAESLEDDIDKNGFGYDDYWKENNEVMVEIITRMMSNYKTGDTLQECLKKVIEERNGETIYPGIDDKTVCEIYVLDTEALTEWMIFGAYDFARENKLKKWIIDICGTDAPLKRNQLNKKFEEYILTRKEEFLSDTQKEMLQMLGFSIEKKIDKEDMKEVATSKKALGALSGSLLDIKAFMQKEDYTKE